MQVLTVFDGEKYRHYKLFFLSAKGYSLGGESTMFFENPVCAWFLIRTSEAKRHRLLFTFPFLLSRSCFCSILCITPCPPARPSSAAPTEFDPSLN